MLYLLHRFLSTAQASATRPPIANTASKPGSVGVGVAGVGVGVCVGAGDTTGGTVGIDVGFDVAVGWGVAAGLPG